MMRLNLPSRRPTDPHRSDGAAAQRFADFRRALKKNAPFLLMLAPGLILLLLFAYLPMFGIIIAFKNYRAVDGILGSEWIGLKNFEFLFRSPVLLRITRNTLLLNALFIVTGTVGSIILALLLNEVRSRLAIKIHQTVLFFPFFISWVIVGYFSYALLNADTGLINGILKALDMKPITWYSSPQYWPTILTLTKLWKGVGYGSVIYLAAMLAINHEYYEAAMLDGASKLQQIRYITLPFLVPIMVITTLLAIGGIFSADFGMFFYVTRDSTLLYPTTDVIDTFVVRALRVNADIGMASATGLYQSIVGFILVMLSNWLVKRIDPDRSLF
jgi:putative aldouronate transport system permease protein